MENNNLTPMEKEYIDTVNRNKCDPIRIKELKMAGRGHFIERENVKEIIKSDGEEFKKYAQNWKSIKGKWLETPPPPPALPSECSLM